MKKWIGAMVLSVVVALLRALNRARMAREGVRHTIQATPLVLDAYDAARPGCSLGVE